MSRSIAYGLRRYTTHIKPVELAYDRYSTHSNGCQHPLIICHGLFGSKQNWTSFAKRLNQCVKRDVYAVDLRNHGDSPHDPTHTYQAMTADMLHFIKTLKLESPILMGHSMGGKAVMATAFQAQDIVSRLIVLDMPPVPLPLSSNFAKYVEAMRAVEEAAPRKQSEADSILANYEPNDAIRMFLLTNLKRQADGFLRFRIPYNTLGQSLSEIASFDFNSIFDKPTLFLAGGKSPYRQPFEEESEKIRTMFPRSQYATIPEAGHWIHSENPKAVLDHCIKFIDE